MEYIRLIPIPVISDIWSPNCLIGWPIVLGSIVFFKLFSDISFRFTDVPASVYRGYKDEQRVFRWRNLFISSFHAFITGCWSLACVVMYGEFMLADFIVYVNWPMYILCGFAAGYFAYDSLDILLAGVIDRQWEILLQHWEILLHHIPVLITAAYVITYVELASLIVIGMLIEVNTVFLHRRQLFQLVGKTPHTDQLVRANLYLNMITFVLFRILPLFCLTFVIYYPGALLHPIKLWGYASCIIPINIMNLVLFYRLIRADFWPPVEPRKRQEGNSMVNKLAWKLINLIDPNANDYCKSNANGLRLRHRNGEIRGSNKRA